MLLREIVNDSSEFMFEFLFFGSLDEELVPYVTGTVFVLCFFIFNMFEP